MTHNPFYANEVRMTMTPDKILLHDHPEYTVKERQGELYRDLARFSARRSSKIIPPHYVIEKYSFTSNKRHVVGLAFTARNANRKAHARAVQAAKKKTELDGTEWSDLVEQDIEALINSYAEIKPSLTDLHGRSIVEKLRG